MTYFGQPIALASAVALLTLTAPAAMPRNHLALASQAATASSAAANPSLLRIGTTVVAKLLTTIDSGTCKPGDAVAAEITRDVSQDHKVVLRKGARVIGHVVAADGSSHPRPEYRVAISFKSISMKNGEQAQISFVIQALAIAPRLKEKNEFKAVTTRSPTFLRQPLPVVASGDLFPKGCFNRRIPAFTASRGSASP